MTADSEPKYVTGKGERSNSDVSGTHHGHAPVPAFRSCLCLSRATRTQPRISSSGMKTSQQSAVSTENNKLGCGLSKL